VQAQPKKVVQLRRRGFVFQCRSEGLVCTLKLLLPSKPESPLRVGIRPRMTLHFCLDRWRPYALRYRERPIDDCGHQQECKPDRCPMRTRPDTSKIKPSVTNHFVVKYDTPCTQTDSRLTGEWQLSDYFEPYWSSHFNSSRTLI
jgi:hypothetical protein